ncbi:hypothetical protein OIU77_027252 [Salix suchowensis]|uniref:Uncharacterized protein n=1 Tax=Salix suchowensis TaxID=1278906 RepID=A0ABQ9BNY9_9ROSI|nr:hypothetical protein OIU77_027252 [Salix suchowensis]
METQLAELERLQTRILNRISKLERSISPPKQQQQQQPLHLRRRRYHRISPLYHSPIKRRE